MNKVSKILTGVAAAAMVTVGAAAPAEAQYRYRDRDRGIDVGDVIAGVAIVGGIAAIAGAVSNSNRRGYDHGYNRYPSYGYGGGYGNYGGAYGNYGGYGGYGEGAAIGACSYQAERYGRGTVRITDVDRRGRSVRVRGVIDNGGYGYDRYDRYDRGRIGFSCTAREDGRVTDFDTNRY
jgi:hypothetical protein